MEITAQQDVVGVSHTQPLEQSLCSKKRTRSKAENPPQAASAISPGMSAGCYMKAVAVPYCRSAGELLKDYAVMCSRSL
jgi:hypothetical protein